jgi:hypothetical protein
MSTSMSSLMSMPMLYVLRCRPCPSCMCASMLHINVRCPQFHVHAHVHSACPCSCWMIMPMLRVFVLAAYPCPFCMPVSKLHIHVHVHAACSCSCHAACPCSCCISICTVYVHIYIYVLYSIADFANLSAHSPQWRRRRVRKKQSTIERPTLYVDIYINAGLSGIQLVRCKNEKTNNAGYNLILDYADDPAIFNEVLKIGLKGHESIIALNL